MQLARLFLLLAFMAPLGFNFPKFMQMAFSKSERAFPFQLVSFARVTCKWGRENDEQASRLMVFLHLTEMILLIFKFWNTLFFSTRIEWICFLISFNCYFLLFRSYIDIVKPKYHQYWGGIQQIVSRTLSGFCYLCQQLAYLVFSRIFLIACKIGELLGNYQEYPAKSVGKQGEEFLIAALVKS
jgi:hypothetical protein